MSLRAKKKPRGGRGLGCIVIGPGSIPAYSQRTVMKIVIKEIKVDLRGVGQLLALLAWLLIH